MPFEIRIANSTYTFRFMTISDYIKMYEEGMYRTTMLYSILSGFFERFEYRPLYGGFKVIPFEINTYKANDFDNDRLLVLTGKEDWFFKF